MRRRADVARVRVTRRCGPGSGGCRVADGGQAVRTTFQRVPFQNADSDLALAADWVVAPSAAQLVAAGQITAMMPMGPPVALMLARCQPPLLQGTRAFSVAVT